MYRTNHAYDARQSDGVSQFHGYEFSEDDEQQNIRAESQPEELFPLKTQFLDGETNTLFTLPSTMTQAEFMRVMRRAFKALQYNDLEKLRAMTAAADPAEPPASSKDEEHTFDLDSFKRLRIKFVNHNQEVVGSLEFDKENSTAMPRLNMKVDLFV